MKKQNVYQQLSKKYGLPQHVVEVICNSPFKFANRVMQDPEDCTTIMFAYLFKIKLKNFYAGNKQRNKKERFEE